MDNQIEYIVYGKTTPNGTYAVLSHSPAAVLENVTRWQEQIPLLPFDAPNEPETRAVAIVQDVDDFILALGVYRGGNSALPLYYYLQVPAETMMRIGSDIQLLQQTAEAISLDGTDAKPVRLSASVTWTAEKRIALLNRVLAEFDGQFEVLGMLMNAALQPEGLLIEHYPANHEARIRLVQAIMLLLPLPLRSEITFTTHTRAVPAQQPRIIFRDDQTPAGQWVFDAKTRHFHSAVPLNPYAAYLLELWQGSVARLVESLRAIDRIAIYSLKANGKQNIWIPLVQQHQLDTAILNDEPVDIDTLLEALDSGYPPPGEFRLPYLEKLLRLTLDKRHTAAAERVAYEMDADPLVDKRLNAVLEHNLETQPDEVYAFIRPHLNEKPVEPWLTRLHTAAEKSLEVAVRDGDAGTLSTWLKLIAREPAHYHLENVLRNGIRATLPRATEDPQLAVDLLTLAVRRAPDTVPILLANQGLMTVLPQEIYAALVTLDAGAIEELATLSRELFLLALHRVIEEQQGSISVTAAQLLWEIYQNRGNFPAGQYHPAAVIREVLQADSACLADGVLEVLLTAMLADQEDTLFHEIAPVLAEQGLLQPALAATLEQSGRTNSDVMTLLNDLAAANVMNYREQVDSYVALLLSRSRNGGTPLLIEQLARLLNQHADVSVPTAVLWMMLDIAAEAKSDQMMRVALKRLVIELNGTPSEAQIAESLLRLRRATAWSSQARSIILNWWREFAGTQPLVKLQKLEKALEAKKGLEDMRGVIHTALAIRRVLGQKSLDEFARDIGVTYRVLQTLADGFDPDDNKQINIDTDTLRTIMAARADELPPDVKQVLATNFRALAELIVSLAENRSKPTLLNRNDEAVFRALMTGEHPPDGAVDVMKFLSGLLDGVGQHKPAE